MFTTEYCEKDLPSKEKMVKIDFEKKLYYLI